MIVETWSAQLAPTVHVIWQKALTLGAAAQRNQGVASSTQRFIWFFDDDILFEPLCVERLWHAIEGDPRLGGVNAMITNQRYQAPGCLSRCIFTTLHGSDESTFAGRVIGPAINFLPEDRGDLPDVVLTEWLNTTCTIYRREALPSPAFDSVFTGYSLMEDLTLSLRVAKTWQLANARTARIFHDSQPAAHKADTRKLAEMGLVNRYYVMTKILERRGLSNHIQLFLWEICQIISIVLTKNTRPLFLEFCLGKWRGVLALLG